MISTSRLARAARALALVALVAGCGSSSRSSSKSSSHTAAAATSHTTSQRSGHGPVDVLYAASLQTLMNTSIGPAFHAATGYTFAGFPAGSQELASEIKGRVRQGDVFISAATAINAKLTGSANGNWVSWYAPFASTRLVIGYNPHSRFASALKTKPWYDVVTRSGFRLGFTDPALDPKGVLAVAALDRAAAAAHRPALKRIATDTSDYFPEQDLVGRLQSGQLDAGFFYTVEASAAKIPTVSLGAIAETAPYTITVLNRAPHDAGAVAFVRYLLGSQGMARMKQVGLTVASSPRATGSGVPPALAQVISASP